MRYPFVVLMLLLLLAVLPVMNLPAAPAPDPFGILDIAPPPKDKTAEQHLKSEIDFNTHPDCLRTVCLDPKVKKLASVASMKDARPWLAKNLRVTPEKDGCRLRFTFRAGKRNEQVIIINAFLRAKLHWNDIGGTHLKWTEKSLRMAEDSVVDLEQRVASGQQPHMVNTYREGINDLRYTRIPELRAEIVRLKKYAVIRWAR